MYLQLLQYGRVYSGILKLQSKAQPNGREDEKDKDAVA